MLRGGDRSAGRREGGRDGAGWGPAVRGEAVGTAQGPAPSRPVNPAAPRPHAHLATAMLLVSTKL